jgi:hypothetical protein
MLAQIILHTPVWVWAILAFLVYRGMLASIDRETTIRQVLILPLVLLALSIQGIASTFGANGTAGLSWFACAVVGSVLTWLLFRRDSIAAHPGRGVIFQRGSWMPMMLMMGIFLTKYAVAVLLAMQPQRGQDALFVASVCGLYGVFNGIFIGRLLRIMSEYRQAQMTVAASAY